MKTSNAKTTALFAVLVILAAYVLLWRPQASTLAEVTERRVATEASLSRAQTELAAAQAEPVETEVDPAAEARLRAVPTAPELSALLRDLDGLAVRTGLELATITPGPPTDNADGVGRSVQILVTGEGAREAVYGYVAGLQAFERLIVVEQVDLSDQPDDESSGDPGLQLQLNLRAFVATASAAAMAAEAAEAAGAAPASD